MRPIFFTVIILFLSTFSEAQDTLYRMDGTQAIVKLIEINSNQLTYKLTSYLAGPTYSISREDVIKVVYENGIIDVFSQEIAVNGHRDRKEDPRATDYGRNFIAVNVIDLLNDAASVSYEHTFKSGSSGMKLRFSHNFSNRQYSFYSKLFRTGVDYNFYPYGQGEVKFFYGPSFEYTGNKSDDDYDRTSEVALLLQGGFLFQPSKHFNMSANLGFGYSQIISHFYGIGNFEGRIGVNLGYKF